MLNPVVGELFCVDKPLGATSFNVTKKVRAYLRTHLGGYRNLHVGHAGTLDPLATGVLIICTGRMTKQIEQIQSGVKQYTATLRLGETTPSFDRETPVDGTYPWRHITRDRIEQVLRTQFTGTIEQVPPAFSACKVDGKPAYKLARKGKDVEIKPKTLVIDDIRIVDCGLPAEPTLTIDVTCSKGTYIRALARDIGVALGSGAHLTALRRTRVGDITVDRCEALPDLLARLDAEQYVAPDDALQMLLDQEREANRLRARRQKEAKSKQ